MAARSADFQFKITCNITLCTSQLLAELEAAGKVVKRNGYETPPRCSL
jgi:hypothetical protein